jgi:type IV pilus assembly protein PilV
MLIKPVAAPVQHGFSMIEVLVALLVLAIGLLGILVMQARGLQLNQAAYMQSQAMFLAEDVVERIRSNQTAIDSYATDFDDAGDDSAGNCENVSSPCSDAEMAASDLWQWKTQVRNALPQGEGSIAIGAAVDNLVPVTVQVQFFQGETFAYQLETSL